MKKQKNITLLLQEHIEDDRKRFDKQEDDHREFRATLQEIKGFMTNLAWLSDISKGTQLLKKPSLWLIAFILGIIALMGGLKTLLAGIVSWVTFK